LRIVRPQASQDTDSWVGFSSFFTA